MKPFVPLTRTSAKHFERAAAVKPVVRCSESQERILAMLDAGLHPKAWSLDIDLRGVILLRTAKAVLITKRLEVMRYDIDA